MKLTGMQISETNMKSNGLFISKPILMITDMYRLVALRLKSIS